MQNHFLQTFITSYRKCLPQTYSKLIQKLNEHPNLIVHKPIVAQGSLHPLNIKLQLSKQSKPIIKGINIFMLSTSQSFSNIQLIGATSQDKVRIGEFFDKSQGQFDMLESQEARGLFRLIIQVYANNVDSRNEMPMQRYANLLFNQASYEKNKIQESLIRKLGFDFNLQDHVKQIRSFHLQNILLSNAQTIKKMFKYLSQNFIKTATDQQQFAHLLLLIRAQMRQVHENSAISNFVKGQQNQNVQVLSPLLSSLHGSYNPNCILVGKYFTHLRQSYYCLQTLRNIEPGEYLTIPVRKNLNNYDRLIRYGYKSIMQNPQNPQNQYILLLNLMDNQIPEVQQILSTNIEQKQQCLSQSNLKMKYVIKINKNGRIVDNDLKMLRILFGQFQQKQLQKDQIQVDRRIYDFVGKFVESSLAVHQEQAQKAENSKGNVKTNQDIVKSFRIVQKGEIQILQNFMKMKKNICGK